MNNVYIIGAKQISVQSPLVEEWMDKPLFYNDSLVQAIDPDYKQYFAPNVARRLGKILKRAMLTSQLLMEETGITNPDAIITGTGLGCVENTELFLDALTLEGEKMLSPTHFMQSTHNTISSLVAINAHCHGYNSTYTHKGISFECALLDAFMQLQSGGIQTALVGAHDEITSKYFTMLKRIGNLGHAENGFSSETSTCMMLATSQKENAFCRLGGIEILYRPDKKELQRALLQLLEQSQCALGEIDAVMIGLNNQKENDQIYAEVCHDLFSSMKLLHYKHLFGESYSASGLGVYVAATCLHKQRIPAFLFVNSEEKEQKGIKRILFYNQLEDKNHTLVLLESCGE